MNILEAAENGNIERIKELLSEGVDLNLNLESKFGRTALFAAVTRTSDTGSLETVKFLINSGANVNIKDKEGTTPLMLASLYSRDGSSDATVRLLLDSGADVNSQDNAGIPALFMSAAKSSTISSIDTVKILLNAGANPNIVTIKGDNSLFFAENIETVRLLLESGADPLININKMTCRTEECKQLVYGAAWKKIYSTDMMAASKYGKYSMSADVWKIILLNKRQEMLCRNLNSSANFYLLVAFAMELGLDLEVVKGLTKGQLCGEIARQLAYGPEAASRGKGSQDIEDMRKTIYRMARKFNISTEGKSLYAISNEIGMRL